QPEIIAPARGWRIDSRPWCRRSKGSRPSRSRSSSTTSNVPCVRSMRGYVVPSLERTTAEMEAAGHPVVARIHSFGKAGDGAAAHYDTAEALSFLVEAVEPPSEMPPTDFTL